MFIREDSEGRLPMQIMEAKIQNYKSLKDVEINEFGNLMVLIGRNSSGKSNFLEALSLFFSEFDPALQRDVGEVPDLLWYNRETETPIKFTVTVKLDKSEYNQIFPEDISDILGIAFENGKLTICREINFSVPNTAAWRTSYVALNNVPIIEDGKLVSELPSKELIPVEEPPSEESVSVEEPTPTEELSLEEFVSVEEPPLEELVSVEEPPSEELVSVEEPPSEESVSVEEPPPTEELSSEELTTVISEAEIISKILTNISKRIKNIFKLILPVRNNLSSMPTLGERSIAIPSHILADIVNIEQSEKRTDIILWDEIEKDVKEVQSLSSLRVRSGGQLRCKEGLIHFPIQYIGGGDQELLSLTFLLRKEKAKIFAIEEPETHLHPNLSRKFFNILKEICENKQIILSTHSPIFIDALNLDNAWIFRKDGIETKPFRIQRAEDLRIINYELGIRPSDIFLADRVLFVEGSIDKTVYRIWAEKRKIDLNSPYISVIPLRGKTRGKRHLHAWNEVMKNIPISLYMILDKDAEKEVDKLVEKGLIDRRLISVLNKGAIEDYYDIDILMDVMKEKYGEEFTEKNLKPSISKGLMKFLRKKHRDWKTLWRVKAEIAEEVAIKTPKEKIDIEIIGILERTETYLAL